MFTAKDVQLLREKTGVGMMDCKKALTESNGDMEEAIKLLREKGLAAASKKASRIAAEGIVDAYIHMGGRIGVLVEVNCETDFVAKTDEYKELVHDIALQIAASNPKYIDRSEVPAAVVEAERELLMHQAINEGKPANVAEKMVAGRIEKFYKENCLVDQIFVKNPDITIGAMITEKIAKIGEKISVRRFVRFEMGEGLEKRSNDFAAEVMEQAAKA